MTQIIRHQLGDELEELNTIVHSNPTNETEISMTDINTYDIEYINWLKEIKDSVRKAQIKTALVANASLIEFYFSLGKMISDKDAVWGSKFLQRLSDDLRQEFPQIKGFSVTNLKYCKLFYQYVRIRPQVGDELNSLINRDLYEKMRALPWGHITLSTKSKTLNKPNSTFNKA